MARSSSWPIAAALLLLVGALAAEAVIARAAPRPGATPAAPAEPPQKFHGLMSAPPDEVRARIGQPDFARSEGSGAMWTYRLPDCALFVFFRAPKDAPPGTGLKVSGAAAGPRVRGRASPPVNECIAEAITRQASLR